MNITKEELEKVKEEIFNKYITKEELEKNEKIIEEEIEKILLSFNNQEEPIDE